MAIRAAGTFGKGAMHRMFVTMVTLILTTSLLSAGSGGTAAAATEFSFWNLDGCRHTWMGAAEAFKPGVCGSKSEVGWGRNAAANQMYHWVENGWQFQGIYNRGTMDTPNGIFIVPFVFEGEEHIFVWDYAEKSWYHIFIDTRSVQAVPTSPELETTSGWRPFSEVGSPKLDTMVQVWQDLKDEIINFIPA